jgi:hypothetical protein
MGSADAPPPIHRPLDYHMTSYRIAIRFLRAASLAAAMLLPTAERARAQGPTFMIVANASNPAVNLSRDQASKLFLKKTARWANGQAVMPVDLVPNAPARAAFSRFVLGRGISAIESYWQQQIFSGRDVPPPAMASEQDVLRFVQSNPGAVGYVSAGLDLVPGVKVVRVVAD